MAAPSRAIRGPGTRSGSTSGVQLVGLKELRKELRKLEDPKTWTKELAAIHRDIAKQVAAEARGDAVAAGGSAQHFSKAIRGYGSAASARIGIADPNSYATFWGAKQDHTGWNAGNRGRPNQPEWVGNSWDVGVKGQGPHVINDAIASRVDWIVDRYSEGLDDLTRRAFPD